MMAKEAPLKKKRVHFRGSRFMFGLRWELWGDHGGGIERLKKRKMKTKWYTSKILQLCFNSCADKIMKTLFSPDRFAILLENGKEIQYLSKCAKKYTKVKGEQGQNRSNWQIGVQSRESQKEKGNDRVEMKSEMLTGRKLLRLILFGPWTSVDPSRSARKSWTKFSSALFAEMVLFRSLSASSSSSSWSLSIENLEPADNTRREISKDTQDKPQNPEPRRQKTDSSNQRENHGHLYSRGVCKRGVVPCGRGSALSSSHL